MTASLVLSLVLAAAAPAAPETPKRPVVDVYQGTKVVDDYRWLENASDPEVARWSDAQNARAGRARRATGAQGHRPARHRADLVGVSYAFLFAQLGVRYQEVP
jgi:Prolyl oligopeptidase, N-terminal beta-propeller domain